jgi:hypothetical protein
MRRSAQPILDPKPDPKFRPSDSGGRRGLARSSNRRKRGAEMEILLFVLIGLAVFCAVVVGYSRLRAAGAESASLTEPRSMVHVIGSEDELREALSRAAQIERDVADVALSRAAQYEEMLPSAPIADLAAAREKAEEVTAESRPA